MSSALRWLVFPLVLGGCTVAAMLAVDSGVDTDLVVIVLPGLGAGLTFGFERLLPYRSEWNRGHGDVFTDVLHTVLSLGLASRLFDLLVLGALVAASDALRASTGITPWPVSWPLVAQLGLALVVGELGAYATHRIGHQVPFFWRWHATHHSAPRLYFLNAARIHPLDALLSVAAWLGPLALLGAPEPVLAVALVFTSVHGSLQHSNVDLRIGWLNWVFSGPELHRWHHERTPPHRDSNYGQTLIVWDLVFGTRHLPAGELPSADIGLEGLPSFPTDWWGQVLSPLRWARAQRVSSPPE